MRFILIEDTTGAMGDVTIGSQMGLPDGSGPVDVMQMSFVIEVIGRAKNSAKPVSLKKEDQIWYQYSSASLLDKVDDITGDIVMRELRTSERDLMNKFKRSPHKGSHQFRAVYKNGATHIQSNAEDISSLTYRTGGDGLNLMTTQRSEHVLKSVNLMDIQGKSFIIEDATESNCENLASLGIQGHCDGNLWIEQL